MRKNNQTLLSNKEKTRHFYSAYFFSIGASKELKNKFKNETVEKLKNQIEETQKLKKEKLEQQEKNKRKNKKSKLQTRLEILKFVAIGATVGVLGYMAIDKLNHLYKSFVKPKINLLKKQSEEIEVPDYQITEKINSKFPNFEEKYVKPVKDNISGALGIKNELLINSAYNKTKGGPIGVILPHFALLTLIYVFRKLGHDWFLEVI